MKILEIEMVSENLESLQDFYKGKLGLPTDLSSDCQRLHIYAGETRLIFKKISGQKPIYHFAFEIPYERVDELYEQMKEIVQILPVTDTSYITDFASWKARSFYFYDPAGNILEYIGRAEADIYSSQSIAENPILFVSEMGIVTPKVPDTVSFIQQHYGIPVFSKQPPMAEFAALGTDRGLFVVVAENRAWYPTQIPAASFPACIVFEQDGKVHEWASQ